MTDSRWHVVRRRPGAAGCVAVAGVLAALSGILSAAGAPLGFVEAEFDGIGGVDGLDGSEHLALDPTGSQLYVVGLLDGALAVFDRDGATGELDFVEVHRDNQNGVNGLAGASWVAVSPDGENVYVAGRFDDAVANFSRNPANGRLTFIGSVFDNQGGIDGLAEVTSVAISPDGAHAYAAGQGDRKLAVFDRGLATGSLSFVTAVDDTLPDANIDIDDHRSLVLSPDGGHLYVVNHVEDLADGWIATFSRNPGNGLLTAVPPVLLGDHVDLCLLGIEGDSMLAFDPDGRFAVANLTFDAAVVLFEVDPVSGRLVSLGGVCDQTIGMGSPPGEPDGLWGCQAVAFNPDGRHVSVAAGNLEDAVAVLVGPAIFDDGFESGTTGGWSAVVGGT